MCDAIDALERRQFSFRHRSTNRQPNLMIAERGAHSEGTPAGIWPL